jgi:FlaA1/EpsC-like NDP-sugar epimerase
MLLAFLIRFASDGGDVPIQYVNTYLRALIVIVPIRILVFYAFGLYSQLWSHASISELLRIAWVVTIDSAVSGAIIYILPHSGFPRSVLLIGWFMKIGALGSVRLALRLRYEWYRSRQAAGRPGDKTIIYGAGDAGAMLVREFAKHPELGCDVVGLIDDDPYKQGDRVHGKPVLGTRESLEKVVKDHAVTHMVIAMPSVKGSVVREIVQTGQKLGLQLKTVPGIYELVNGAVTVSQIRNVQIEDVLGREEVKVDLEAIAAYLTGEVVLVTGAGGSIGSELCRQVARFGPKQIVLLGHGENSIYEIDMELRGKYPGLDIRPVIADVQDEARIRRVFEQHRPGVVFHAAAHKHVPLMEYNPEEAIKNNVFGTYNVAKAADVFRVKRFVLISSDKAVNPTSVMGATKRAAEIVIQSLARTSSTVFVAVRFGNVLGSRGSVIPLFKKQIAAGGPVTITDARMVRYFMTIPEAVQLVIQASSMGRGGEVFVLDMGKPVRIIDLARDLIRLSGFEPDVDIAIKETGIRPGEKLFEELLTAEEGTAATMHERIFVAHQDSIPGPALSGFLGEMEDLARSGRAGNTNVLALVAEVVGKVTLHGAVGAGD